jgi:anti-sigma regulatory factor (Ser/Thr protein kinase)
MDVETDGVFTLNRYASDTLHSRLHLTIPAAIEYIDPTVDQALSFVSKHCLVGEVEFEIRVALHEAIANAIVHGCKRDSAKQVHCLVACHDAELLIAVRDPGAGFNPDEVPSPTDGDGLFANHGRGVELMRQLMDEVHYERSGAEVHLIKRRHPNRGPLAPRPRK